MYNGKIVVKGAREHNLKDINIELPQNKLIVFTGVSGSGKSSLAFDTLYVEGQRRYIESMSAYARQFLGELERPDVDLIEGLSPTISIDQSSVSNNPRSTVGTITEIYDYLRALFAAIGKPHCPQCGTPISSQTSDEIVDNILKLSDNTRIQILAPIIRGRRGEHKAELESVLKSGFARARIDGEIFDLMNDIGLERNQRHDIDIVVDRIIVKEGIRSRIAESVETALELSDGSLIVNIVPKKGESDSSEQDIVFNTSFACPKCNISFQPLSPTDFSFNSPYGMCHNCSGLGAKDKIIPELVVFDQSKSIKEGAIVFWGELDKLGAKHIAEGLAKHYGFSLDTPWEKLTEEQQNAILYGSGEQKIDFVYKNSNGKKWHYRKAYEGVIPFYEQKYLETESRKQKRFLSQFISTQVCPQCKGKRLKPEALAVTIGGQSIADLSEMPIDRCVDFFENLELSEQDIFIVQELLKEIVQRLHFLRDVGLNYLTLNRSTPTLSNGEAQRIRLASQIGSGLRGVLYILDEPSIGLHPRDHGRLLSTLVKLRDKGNTIVVVEHDEDTMWNADLIVDFGPEAGVRGGEIVTVGTPEQICNHHGSITGEYLSDKRKIEIPEKRRLPDGKWLKLIGARHHNLKNIDIEFPLGTFICVTGVSGSGKSSLVNETLYRTLAREFTTSKTVPGEHDEIQGIENIDKVIDVDQSPIGQTPRSCPATYIKVFDEIRRIFAELSESKLRGYKVGRFSFNVKAGRCEACKGMGTKTIEMHFLPDVEVKCEVCHGKRYSEETLQIKYRGKSIADVLDMDAQEARQHFENVPKIREMLQVLCDVGLDYIKLGQPSPTLSGGEAQRIKLAKELVRPDTGSTLYIFDEPTTGLHFADIQKLLNVFQRLVDDGNTVLVVEHNPEIIKSADYIIDLGPEGGDKGGEVVATGTPEEVADVESSATGTVLKKALSENRKARKPESRKAGKPESRKAVYATLNTQHDTFSSKKSIVLERSEEREAKRTRNTQQKGWESRDLRSKGRQHETQSTSNTSDFLKVIGAREHNLKDINVEIPHNKLITFTGISGSGKSSMALDTIYAEGQRRYVQTLSTYTRQFLGQFEKPHVDWIDGISPAIAIEQKPPSQNPRSTVGTLSEIYDYIRVLYARVGIPHCPKCGQEIGTQTRQQIVEQIMNLPEDTRIYINSPVELKDGENYSDAFQRANRSGYIRVFIDGKAYRISDAPELDKRIIHDVAVVIDRLKIRTEVYERIAEAVENALNWSDGIVELQIMNYELRTESREPEFQKAFETRNTKHATRNTQHEKLVFSKHFACVRCGKSFEELIPQDFSFNNSIGMCSTCRGLGVFGNGEVCPDCKGARIKDKARTVTLAGRTIMEVSELSIEEALEFFENLSFSGQKAEIAEELLREIRSRLQFLIDVGLHYLTLSRNAPTLARGEFQRINFASQLGSNLSGVLYVLDEPSVSLHHRDHQRLLYALERLIDRGNSIIMIEHDRDTMLSSDELVDFGPGAGENGGQVVAQGTPEEISQNNTSLTGNYLNGSLKIDVPEIRKKGSGKSIKIIGAKHNNLKDIDVEIPLGVFVCVTGVSGAGKSSLVEDILYKALLLQTQDRTQGDLDEKPGEHQEIKGIEQIQKVINIDQSSIGRTPRSNPATYTKCFDEIRDFFAELSESKVRGFDKTRFSFNRKGGRCEACRGYGYKKVEMRFLADVWVKCDVCDGNRYNSETLTVKYKGKNIADVLDMTVNEALDFFYNVPKIRRQLEVLRDVGLDYVKIGQPSSTLSGGESQRLRLARELGKSTYEENLYIMDEPTTGLHAADIQKLLKVIERLVSEESTVIVIEHNMELIKCADYLIDLGPEGGYEGGRIVGTGTPEQIAQNDSSYTGKYLREYLY